MSAHDLHHKITACQQQVETLQSAASPRQSQGVLLEMLAALQVSLAELHVAEAARRQRHDDLLVAHQQVEMGLRNSEARTHAMLQTAVDGIITIDMRGTIESFNPAAAAIPRWEWVRRCWEWVRR